MKAELQEKLYQKYPEIFQQKDLDMTLTAMCWGISCGDGWYNILDVLCGELQELVNNPKRDLELYEKLLEEAKFKNDEEGEIVWTEKVANAKEKIIPQIQAVQVKEKYGTLRFYTDTYNSEISALISFAESMSAITCEQCGAPGSQTGGGWIQTKCDKC
jgi:hypothetical protein